MATQDAGEGNDHFIFISTNPADAVSTPWAKAGQVSRWLAFLADENDNDFRGWFDAAGSKSPMYSQPGPPPMSKMAGGWRACWI